MKNINTTQIAIFTKLNGSQIYAVDSFSIEREKKSKLWRDILLKGYNISKRKFFYTLKG